MAYLTLKDAKSLADECFPRGPEEIAEAMGVAVEYCPMTGTDGWCMQRKGHAPKIRVNATAVKPRQRFTLAHELAHLLLGTDPEIVSQSILPFQSVKKEERAADKLASELLVPLVHLKQIVKELPVDAKTIKSLANKGSVSDMVAAGRIVSEAAAIGLVNAGMAVFKDGVVQWCWSPSLTNLEPAARQLFAPAQKALPAVFRSAPNANGDVQTATVVGSPEYPVLLVQLLPVSVASTQTHHEKSRELDKELFDQDHSFRQSFNGCLSSFKSKAEQLELDDAVDQFNKRYHDWPRDRLRKLRSQAGQAYLRHRLSAWVKSSTG
ncbi:MAG: ImmA/IrrE family metallo-endopeptidase [Phycisphaerales bacterium]